MFRQQTNPEVTSPAEPQRVPVRIRTVRSDDGPRLDDYVARLSVDSRGKRFHGSTRQRAEAAIALVATVNLADVGEVVIGEACYSMWGDAAEFVVSVADAWQGHGLAEHLVDQLIACARDAGLRAICAEVLASNGRMIGFLHRMGFEISDLGSDERTLRMERGVLPRIVRRGGVGDAGAPPGPAVRRQARQPLLAA